MNQYEENLANFRDMILFFEAKFNKGSKPMIWYYEGKKELWEVYKKDFYLWWNLFFGVDIGKLLEVFPVIIEDLGRVYTKKKIVKELVVYNQAGVDYAKKYKKSGQYK